MSAALPAPVASDMASPILLTVCQAAELLCVSRSTAYRLLRDGDLEVVRIGRAARVPRTSVIDLVDRLRDNVS